MRRLDSVSLLCLDTRDPEAASLVMTHCLDLMDFGEAVLITSYGFVCSDPRIRVYHIDPLRSIEDYSSFMIKKVGEYFSCPYLLVIQWDGFIVNPEAWSDEYFRYDYIGAPWLNQKFAVGNGGFSFRSRKLINALQDPEISILHPEDNTICLFYHEYLHSKYDISFPPLSVASQFSCETIKPDVKTFGFHGVGTLPWVAESKKLKHLFRLIPHSALLSQPTYTLIKRLASEGRGAESLPLIGYRFVNGTAAQKLDAIKLLLRALFSSVRSQKNFV